MALLEVGRSVNPGGGQHTERRNPHTGSMEKECRSRERTGNSLDWSIVDRVWYFAEGLGGKTLPAEAVNGFFRVVKLLGEDKIKILWTLAVWGDSGKEARKNIRKEKVSSVRHGFDYAPPIQHVETLITVSSHVTYLVISNVIH